MKPNAEIRSLATDNNVFLWEIGKEVGKSEQTIVKWLRDDPMPEDRKQMVVNAIKCISARKSQERKNNAF